MMIPELASSPSHLVIIPSYNCGSRVTETVRTALHYWRPVWVVIDGSTDSSFRQLEELESTVSGLRVLKLEENRGKGAAVLHGMAVARDNGFEFALVMDADGQHPANQIQEFMTASSQNPDAMILGEPQFGYDAPTARRNGRRIGNWWTNLETLWGGIHDSLFGFRVYPLAEALAALQHISGGRRYDFDTQLVVRLFWMGVCPINIPASVRYFTKGEGGVTHFNYLRDNLLLVWTHIQLVLQAPFRMLVRQKMKNSRRIYGRIR